MRQRYTTIILRLSSYVERKKRSLLTKHSLKSFFDVLLLVLAEVLFAVVSLPLLIVAKPVGKSAEVQKYAIRRTLTMGVVGIVLALWALKIGFIVLRQWTDERVVNVREANSLGAEQFAMPRIAAAPEDASVDAPVITGMGGTDSTGWTVYGSGPKGHEVAVYVTRTDGSAQSVNVYLGTIDAGGNFAVKEARDRFRLQGGEYAAQAFAYDAQRGVKSTGSAVVTTLAQETIFEKLLSRADVILNTAVATVIVVGLLLTLLFI